MCIMYQILYALTSFREWWSGLILGHRTPYMAGVCCMYRGMPITHRRRRQIKDSFSIKTKMINIDNYPLIRYVNPS